jgi:hypothetical protein
MAKRLAPCVVDLKTALGRAPAFERFRIAVIATRADGHERSFASPPEDFIRLMSARAARLFSDSFALSSRFLGRTDLRSFLACSGRAHALQHHVMLGHHLAKDSFRLLQRVAMRRDLPAESEGAQSGSCRSVSIPPPRVPYDCRWYTRCY